jgi:hypothetical protein
MNRLSAKTLRVNRGLTVGFIVGVALTLGMGATVPVGNATGASVHGVSPGNLAAFEKTNGSPSAELKADWNGY